MSMLSTPAPLLRDARLPADLLTAVLALTLWVGAGSLLLTIAEGLGDEPTRRLLVGTALVATAAVALWQRERVTIALQRTPALVLLIAAGQILAAGIDGVVGGAFVAFSITSIGIAVVVARARTVWACVLVLQVGYLAALLSTTTFATLSDDGQLGGVIGALVGYPVAAGLFLTLRRRFSRFGATIDETLAEIRTDGDAFTPALGQLLRGDAIGLPAPEPPGARLTPTERRAVEALAAGKAPKEIAFEWGVALSTVRTHLKHAKAKTGARTLPELASLVTRPDWEVHHDVVG